MAYDDAEFAEGMAPGTRPSILSQYDQDKKSAPKFAIGNIILYYIILSLSLPLMLPLTLTLTLLLSEIFKNENISSYVVIAFLI